MRDGHDQCIDCWDKALTYFLAGRMRQEEEGRSIGHCN